MVGAHLLLDLVKSGVEVRAIYRNSNSRKHVQQVFTHQHEPQKAEHLYKKIQWIQADITDIPALEQAFEGVTRVFHCAAKVTFDASQYRSLRKTNIEGTANIVNLSIANKIQKLCFVSSIATLDKKLEETSFSETSYWNQELPHSMYAITKYGAEMEVWRGSQEGVPVVIVNPGVIIGPGFWNSGSGSMFKRVHQGLNYYFPKVTGFVGVYDVVKAMMLLMDSSVQNEQYVLVAENASFKIVLGQVAESLNKPAPSKKLKPWMIFLAWVYQKTLGSFFSKEGQLDKRSPKSLFSESYYSNNKIKTELDFRFESMEEVIARTSAAYLRKADE